MISSLHTNPQRLLQEQTVYKVYLEVDLSDLSTCPLTFAPFLVQQYRGQESGRGSSDHSDRVCPLADGQLSPDSTGETEE